MKWFRLYSCVLNDPKVQKLSPALFKHWINLLCLANEHEPRGELPPLDEIAFALRIKASEARKVMEHLEHVGLIDVESSSENRRTFPHNWPQRQRASDDIATRVERHRHRKNAESGEGAIGNVTLHETLLKRTVDTDTERDTEEETFPLSDEGITKRESAPVIREPLARPRTPSPQQQQQQPPERRSKPPKEPREPKEPKEPIPLKPKAVNPLWDVLCEVFYTPQTKAERSNFGKIVKELTEIHATADDVRYRIKQHARAQSHWDLTPNALVTHWAELGRGNGKAAATNGTSSIGTTHHEFYDPEKDEALLARKRAGAEMVRRIYQQ